MSGINLKGNAYQGLAGKDLLNKLHGDLKDLSAKGGGKKQSNLTVNNDVIGIKKEIKPEKTGLFQKFMNFSSSNNNSTGKSKTNENDSTLKETFQEICLKAANGNKTYGMMLEDCLNRSLEGHSQGGGITAKNAASVVSDLIVTYDNLEAAQNVENSDVDLKVFLIKSDFKSEPSKTNSETEYTGIDSNEFPQEDVEDKPIDSKTLASAINSMKASDLNGMSKTQLFDKIQKYDAEAFLEFITNLPEEAAMTLGVKMGAIDALIDFKMDSPKNEMSLNESHVINEYEYTIDKSIKLSNHSNQIENSQSSSNETIIIKDNEIEYSITKTDDSVSNSNFDNLGPPILNASRQDVNRLINFLDGEQYGHLVDLFLKEDIDSLEAINSMIDRDWDDFADKYGLDEFQVKDIRDLVKGELDPSKKEDTGSKKEIYDFMKSIGRTFDAPDFLIAGATTVADIANLTDNQLKEIIDTGGVKRENAIMIRNAAQQALQNS
ncbi:MAG: hypothetical protein AAGF76_06435 [Pseudomonadota bacterium]